MSRRASALSLMRAWPPPRTSMSPPDREDPGDWSGTVVLWALRSPCDLGCRYCYFGTVEEHRVWPDVRAGQLSHLSRTDLPAAEVLAFAATMAGSPVRRVFLAGGEPLRWPPVLDLIRVIKSAGVQVVICTNGIALNRPEITSALVDAGADAVSVSLDSVDPAHNDRWRPSRNHKDGWAQVISGITALARARSGDGRPRIGVYTVITRLNIANIVSVPQLAAGLGCDYAVAQPISLPPVHALYGELALTPADVPAVTAAFTRLADAGLPLALPAAHLPGPGRQVDRRAGLCRARLFRREHAGLHRAGRIAVGLPVLAADRCHSARPPCHHQGRRRQGPVRRPATVRRLRPVLRQLRQHVAADGLRPVPSRDARRVMSRLPAPGAALRMVGDVLDQMLEPAADGQVRALEAEVEAATGTRHAIAVSSGTAALHTALAACGAGPGDEVLVPAVSVIMTIAAVIAVGARPVLVDAGTDGEPIDLGDLSAKITRRTRAILPVHFAGRTGDMDALLRTAGAHDLVVIEDACQAQGSRYRGRLAGTLGQAGCFPSRTASSSPAERAATS